MTTDIPDTYRLAHIIAAFRLYAAKLREQAAAAKKARK